MQIFVKHGPLRPRLAGIVLMSFPCFHLFGSTHRSGRRRTGSFQTRFRLFRDIRVLVRLRGFTTDEIRIHFTSIGPIRNASIPARGFFRRTRPRAQLLVLRRRIRFIRNHGFQAADHLIQHLIDPVCQVDGLLIRGVRVLNRPRHVPTPIHDPLKVLRNLRSFRSLRK